MIEGSCHCGAVRWRLDATPEAATACNCTVCRRYGVLWAYGHEGENVEVSGTTRAYLRGESSPLAFHFCADCGCIAYWRAVAPHKGRRRIAVNLRLAEPEAVASITIDHLDGLESWRNIPRSSHSVGDMWF